MVLSSPRHSKGMSLVSVLVAVAVAGILTAVLASIFSNMADLGVRTRQLSDADNLVRYLKGVFARTATCNGAMRGAGPGYAAVVWGDPDTAGEVFRVRLPNGTPIVTKNDKLNPRLRVESMWLRQPIGPPTEGAALETPWIAPGNIPYTIYSAILEVRFDADTGAAPMKMGGNIRRRTIAVTVARRDSNGVVDLCYQDQQLPPLNTDCTTVTPPNPDCPSVSDPCFETYFIAGFDAVGRPICKCQVTCTTTIPPPPPGVGKGSGSGGVGN